MLTRILVALQRELTHHLSDGAQRSARLEQHRHQVTLRQLHASRATPGERRPRPPGDARPKPQLRTRQPLDTTAEELPE